MSTQFRGFFTQFIVTSPLELLKAITLTHQEVTGEIAYIIWKAEPFIPFASDTFLIRDDTIVVQTFARLASCYLVLPHRETI